MVESSMARSYFQLCGLRNCVTEWILAMCVPMWREHGSSCLFAPLLPQVCCHRWAIKVRLYGLLPLVAALCCTNATHATRATHAADSRQQTATDASSALQTRLPSETDAITAFVTAREWLDQDQVPPLDAPESRVTLGAEVEGVAIILRFDGRAIGLGTAECDPNARDASRALLLRRAFGKAVARALGDETVRAVRGALQDKVTARLSLEIELAGPSRPLLGRTIKDAAARVVPGRDGLMLYRGDTRYFAYPSHMLAQDTALQPEFIVTALLRDAGLPVKELNEYSTEQRVSLARFATLRLRQPNAASAPALVERGGTTVPLGAATPALGRALATLLCARLAAQVVSEDAKDAAQSATSSARLLGSYNPTADEYQPPFATDRDAALAAVALARAARSAQIPDTLRARARAQATRLLDGLRAKDAALESASTMEPETIAMALFAAGDNLKSTPTSDAGSLEISHETPPSPSPSTSPSMTANLARVSFFRDSLSAWKLAKDSQPSRAFSLRAQIAVACAVLATDALAPRVGDGATRSAAALDAHALLLSLFARVSAKTANDVGNLEGDAVDVVETGEPRADDTTAQTTRASLVQAALPLSLLTELPASQLGSDLAQEVSKFFEETLLAVSRAQITPDPELDIAADIEGGLPLTQGRSTRADTRCLLLAAALRITREDPTRVAAPAGGDARGNASDTSALTSALTATVERRFLRFLAQHVADSPWCEGFRNPDALRGLVRASLATDDCPAAATPAGLLLALGRVE